MVLERLPYRLTVCKLSDAAGINWNGGFYFLGKTDEELSLVCETEETPSNATEREDGWRGFRVKGTLEFSLTGILAGLSRALAEAEIGIFAVSTYNTDYILVKAENFDRALEALQAAGYAVV